MRESTSAGLREARRVTWIGAAVLGVAVAAAGSNPLHHPQPANQPDEFYVLIEIPAAGAVKYEADVRTGTLVVDRFLAMPMAYPANYGSVTSSLQDDGDPLDALVITRAPLQPGVLIRVRPLGVLRMTDGGEVDDKIITIPASGVDRTFDSVQELEDLPLMDRKRLRAFFETYKKLSDAEITIKGFEDASVARRLVDEAVGRFKAQEKPTDH